MNIGQKINEFDNSLDDTLKDFNEKFNTDIKGNPASRVEIGNIITGGFREIFIDDVKQIVNLNPSRNEKLLKNKTRLKNIYIAHFEGKQVGKYADYKHLANALNSNLSTIAYYYKNNLSYFGYTFTSESVSELEYLNLKSKQIKKLNIDRSKKAKNNAGRPKKLKKKTFKNIYIFETEKGQKIKFTSIIKAAKEMKIGRQTIANRLSVKDDRMMNGWKVTKLSKKQQMLKYLKTKAEESKCKQ